MTTTKNPWNQLSNVDINGEQAILATEDVELIKKYTSTKHYKNLKDDIYRLQLGFCPQQFVGDIQNADIILVMVDGDIVEHGNHQELMAARGVYYQMQTAQE